MFTLAIPLFGDTKILHTLIGMGSAALAAAVLYPGKATLIFRKGQRYTRKEKDLQDRYQIY